VGVEGRGRTRHRRARARDRRRGWRRRGRGSGWALRRDGDRECVPDVVGHRANTSRSLHRQSVRSLPRPRRSAATDTRRTTACRRPTRPDSGERLRGLRCPDDRRRGARLREPARVAADGCCRRVGPVEAVEVDLRRDARHGSVAAVLPERPAVSAPSLRGNERARVRRPVRDPERIARVRDVHRVAESGLPEARRRIHECCDAGARGDVIKPRSRPLLESGNSQRAFRLQVQNRRQFSRLRLRDVEEVVRLRDRVRDDAGVARASRPSEVVRTEGQSGGFRRLCGWSRMSGLVYVVLSVALPKANV